MAFHRGAAIPGMASLRNPPPGTSHPPLPQASRYRSADGGGRCGIEEDGTRGVQGAIRASGVDMGSRASRGGSRRRGGWGYLGFAALLSFTRRTHPFEYFILASERLLRGFEVGRVELFTTTSREREMPSLVLSFASLCGRWWWCFSRG